MAQLSTAGKIMRANDPSVAATARHHGLTHITQNEDDFSASGVAIYNPWT